MIKAAQKNYDKFLVPTNLVESVKIKRHYTASQQADLDIKTSVNKIGEIVNLSQELNTLMWHKINNGSSFNDVMGIYYDSSKLCIMSGIEIDSAKKEFTISNTKELKLLSKDYYREDKLGRKIKPNFFAHISKSKGYYNPHKKYYQRHCTAMDYVQKIVSTECHNYRGKSRIKFIDILDRNKFEYSLINYGQIYSTIDCVRQMKADIKNEWRIYFEAQNYNNGVNDRDNYYNTVRETSDIRQNCINYIDSKKYNYSTMYWLLKLLDEPKYRDISYIMFSVLFGAPNKSFYDVIRQSSSPISMITPDDSGDIKIFNIRYSKLYK